MCYSDLILIPQTSAAIPPIVRNTPYIQGKTTAPAKGLTSKSMPSAIVRIPRMAVPNPPPLNAQAILNAP